MGDHLLTDNLTVSNCPNLGTYILHPILVLLKLPSFLSLIPLSSVHQNCFSFYDRFCKNCSSILIFLEEFQFILNVCLQFLLISCMSPLPLRVTFDWHRLPPLYQAYTSNDSNSTVYILPNDCSIFLLKHWHLLIASNYFGSGFNSRFEFLRRPPIYVLFLLGCMFTLLDWFTFEYSSYGFSGSCVQTILSQLVVQAVLSGI